MKKPLSLTGKRAGLRRLSEIWSVILLLASGVTCPGIPGELNEPPPLTTLPHDISPVEAELTCSSNYFVPGKELSTPTNEEHIVWRPAVTNESGFIGRYFEIGYPLGEDILYSGIQGRDRQHALFDPNSVLLDVNEPSGETNDFHEVMQHVAKSIASRNTLVPRQETENYATVVIYLLLAAVIILVAIARR